MYNVMCIVQLPNYKVYWSKELRFSPVADVMPIYRHEELRQTSTFVDKNI